jgi:dTDP-glucose 4,6-dehydratase
MTVLVTGGAGFIGSALIRQLIRETGAEVVNVDCLTYAGNVESLASVAENPRYSFCRTDVADRAGLDAVFRTRRPEVVFHLAAETHVDRSILGPAAFLRSNVEGTFTLLEATRVYWAGIDPEAQRRFRFVHVSTDEVFGSLGSEGLFSESTPYQPNSPYSASKASSDHFVRAWHHTYGLPTITTNCSNNYGPYQFPEKLIPLMVHNAITGRPLPIYGRGDNVRDWLYVDDHVRALRLVALGGVIGETYCIGGNSELTNLEVIDRICNVLDVLQPRADGQSYATQKVNVTDRPGHDRRYAVDTTKIRTQLGWAPLQTFGTGLQATVEWYLANPDWVGRVVSGEYRSWVETNYGATADRGQGTK